MDLHPLNVMIGAEGPVVIDWPNAARGDPVVDVVLAWVLMAAGEVPTNPVHRRCARLGTGGARSTDSWPTSVPGPDVGQGQAA